MRTIARDVSLHWMTTTGRSRSRKWSNLTVLLVLALAPLVRAQDSHFIFDPNGNLFVETLAISAPPQIIGQPQNRIVAPGDSASFLVVAADTRALSFRWQFTGTNVSGATNDAFLLQNVTANHEGEYRVVLTNPSGSVTSAPAMLMIDSDADGVPDSWETTYFGNLINSATADMDRDGISNLQEFLDGTDPTARASARYRLLLIQDGETVVKAPNQTSYTNGQSVMLTAIAPTNGVFHAWFGDVVTRDNPVTLVMTNNKTVIARFTPIVFTWTNVASGDWDVGANWTPNLPPGSNDTVIIKGNATVTLNHSADCTDLTLGSSNPTLTASGTLTVRGNFLWISGTVSGSGRTILEPGATLELANPGSGVFSLNGHTLENGGTILCSGAGGLGLNFGAVITNRPGGLFDFRNAASLSSTFGANRFDNAGTFRKSTSAGIATIGMAFNNSSMAFNNSGAVEVQIGTLNLAGGGTHTGSFDVLAGTTMNLSGGTHSVGTTCSITGAGHFVVSGGTANLAGLVNVGGSNTFSGGTANLTGNHICTNNTLTISRGTANFSGTGEVSPAVLDLRDGGRLGGTSIVTARTAMNWTSGSMRDSGRTIIPPGATGIMTSPSGVNLSLSGRTFENGGTIVWSGAGPIDLDFGAIITNRAEGSFHVQNAASFNSTFGANRFDNAGTFRKSANTGITTVGSSCCGSGIAFNNYGVVEIETGTLNLVGGGTHTASSSMTGAGHITFSGGTANLAGLVNVSGSNTFSGGTANLLGNYVCTNNTLTISVSGTANFSGIGEVSPAVLELRDSGTLGGTSIVTVRNVMNWTSGSMRDSGRTIIAPGAMATVSSPFGIQFSVFGRTLENGGTLVWSGVGSVGLFSGAIITNRPGALFHVQNARSISSIPGPGRVDNAGTFRKSSTIGTTTIASGIAFNNYGTVDLRSGVLVANGGYVSSPNALLNCTLGGATPGTNYGQLQVAGAVTLDGALSVDFTDGFSPALNDSFTVLIAGARNGSFTSFFYPSNAVTMQSSNGPTSVILRVSNVFTPIPAPILFTPELTGPDLRLSWTAVSNANYRVEFNSDLSLSNWTALAGDVIASSNTASKLEPLTPSNRLYRVRVLP
jgi:hypothetical protein